ncbi:hypothetical protein HCN44_005289 [Aphidius gifuensis]|uniref:1-acylglycerol-3-phosphate O-acyltransferase n=1 Tax=Aphidius gifuensis TaxID=684658 RepID=A0A834Y582_APHGI|nr:hypothetical protein HCN44_005289 [Aphidius gifuensis]
MFDIFWCVIFMLVIVIICVRKKVKYYFKFVVFCLTCVIATSWPILFMLLRPFDWKNATIPAWQLRKMMKFMGMNFIIRGHENIVKNSPAVVIINHQSSLDLVVLAEIWGVIENCILIAKQEILWYSGTLGLAGILWGTVFINRKKHKESVNAMNKTGTRHSDNTLGPFKKGAFNVAISSQAPIQPIVVSKYYYIDHDKKIFNSGKSYITILPAISTEGMTKNDLDTLMKKSYDVMNREFQSLTNEILAKVKRETNE